MKSYELTNKEYKILTAEEKTTYDKAIRYCCNEHAGGHDGWSEGHKLLESIGWRKKSRTVGHRQFTKMIKPARFQQTA